MASYPSAGRPAQSLPQAGAVKPPVKQEPGGAAAGGAAGAAGPAGGAGGSASASASAKKAVPPAACSGCGAAGGDLSQSECGHMSLCNACGRSMAEKQATCQQCGAVVDKLVKEFLVRVKPAKARTRPLLLEDDTGQASYVGHMEGGWQHSAYYLLVMHGKEFVAIPASQWYAFGKQAQYKTLTLEEAELCMQSKRRKADGFRKWLTKEESEKLLAGGGKEGGGGGRGGGRKKGGLDDGLGSDDEGMGGDMEDGEGRKRGQGKKGGDDDDDELPKEEFELEMDGDKGERDLTCVALRMKTYVMARRLLRKKGGGDEDDEVPKEEFELEVDGDKGQDWEHDELLSDDDEATAMQPEDEKEQERCFRYSLTSCLPPCSLQHDELFSDDDEATAMQPEDKEDEKEQERSPAKEAPQKEVFFEAPQKEVFFEAPQKEVFFEAPQKEVFFEAPQKEEEVEEEEEEQEGEGQEEGEGGALSLAGKALKKLLHKAGVEGEEGVGARGIGGAGEEEDGEDDEEDLDIAFSPIFQRGKGAGAAAGGPGAGGGKGDGGAAASVAAGAAAALSAAAAAAAAAAGRGLKRKDLEKGAAGGGASGAGAGAKKGKVEPGKRTPPLPAKREPGAGGSAAGKAGGGTSGGGASGAAAGPKPTAVTEEAVKGILRQAPIKSADLVNRFRSCLKTAEDKKRFQEIIKRVGKIQAVNGEKFIVLR
ncbi:unnamed protein product [Closterium sp. NIES-65]|nr:unnamed protein product [Closterium sp. NIES-65]